MPRVLDWLRGAFPYIVAVLLPLAGVVMAVVRFADDDRDAGIRLLLCALLGTSLLLLLFA